MKCLRRYKRNSRLNDQVCSSLLCLVITNADYCFLGPIAKAVNFGTLDGGYCSHSNDSGCGDATTNLPGTQPGS